MVENTAMTPTNRATPTHESTRSEESYIAPPVDIYDDEQGLVLLADMPGAEPDSVDTRVERGILTIQGKAMHLASSGDPINREFELTGYFRQFQLPEEIDTTRIDAQLKHGVLTLRLPRVERALPRRIQVQAAP